MKYPPTKKHIAKTLLINAIPLAGVIFLSWDLARVMHLFWAETAIICFLIFPILIKTGAEESQYGFFHKLLIVPIGATIVWLYTFATILIVTYGIIGLMLFGPEFGEPTYKIEIQQIFKSILPAIIVYAILYSIPFLKQLPKKHIDPNLIDHYVINTYARIIIITTLYGLATLPIAFFHKSAQLPIFILLFATKAIIEIYIDEIEYRFKKRNPQKS